MHIENGCKRTRYRKSQWPPCSMYTLNNKFKMIFMKLSAIWNHFQVIKYIDYILLFNNQCFKWYSVIRVICMFPIVWPVIFFCVYWFLKYVFGQIIFLVHYSSINVLNAKIIGNPIYQSGVLLVQVIFNYLKK